MLPNDWSVDIGNETEKLEKYHEGGFCPIHLGECIAGRFTILHKLGHGGFGTVWLVRDAASRHGRYVALKVVSAEYSEDYEPAAVLDRLKKYERDHGSPGVFLVELESLFHISRNGRHLCQVFPVLGPPLSSLNTTSALLYPTFIRGFASQLANGLATMHSLGICHGDLSQSRLHLKNLVIKLGKSLEPLTEQELLADDMFGPPRTRSIDRFFPQKPSPAPQYVVGAANLIRLPWDYLSTKICILDFDQAFLADNAPREVPYIPVTYLAPESIFTLTNSPAADVWALGCILFSLRHPMQLFWDVFASDAEATAKTICYTLGPLPKEWMAVPFLDGWPIHESLEPDIQGKPEVIKLVDHSNDKCSLEEVVDGIREPRPPASSTSQKPRTGLEYFCLQVPNIDFRDHAGKERFKAEKKRPIPKEDAKLFVDLLRKMFNYDHTKRLTARQVLEHPWIGAGQETEVPNLDSVKNVDRGRVV